MINLTGLKQVNTKKISIIALVIIVLSISIGYLISPKMIFQPIAYQEGDIILQTVQIKEDILVPDKVSTQLKRDKLLKDQRRIYDYDPQIFEKTQKTIQDSFAQSRAAYEKIAKQNDEMAGKSRQVGLEYFNASSSLQTINNKTQYYEKYRKLLKDRLQWFDSANSLTPKGFEKKAKTDADLNTVNQVLTDLKERQKYFQLQMKGFTERFENLEKDNQVQVQALAEMKKETIENFDKTLSLEMTDQEKDLLDFPYYTQEIETQLLALLSEIQVKKIVVSKEILPEDKNKLEVRNLKTADTSVSEQIEEFLDLSESRALVSQFANESFMDDETGKKKILVVMLGQKLIRPTVFENKLEYEKRKSELIDNTSPVFFSVKKGEVIARAGDRASKSQVELINSYYEFAAKQEKLPETIGVILFVLFALICTSAIFRLPDLHLRIRFKYQILIISSIVVTLMLVKGGALLGELVESRYLNIQNQSYTLILPVALGSMLVGILLSFEAALITGLLSALFCSIMMQNNIYFFIYSIMGCLVASLPMTKFDSRYSILIHGLKISAVSLIMMLIIQLIQSNKIEVFAWFSILAALMNGVLTAIFTSFLLPFFESGFGITTNLKLLELSNMNHPALKDLIRKAPGTYQHSIIVGNLAESAASKIGANPLLSRVAAYYHDIGKASNPLYFIENQPPTLPNIHDSMNPKDSAKIIIRHLHKGAEISEKHRLGKDISDILLQHHGTSLVRYFFNQAVEQNKSEAGENNPINEEDFRYPGPKPQSLEAALVMMADVSEATCRSLDSPTPEQIKEMTDKVCWKLLEGGQLDESGLTLKTFHKTVEIYGSMLTSFYHQRIKYPENESGKPVNAHSRLEN